MMSYLILNDLIVSVIVIWLLHLTFSTLEAIYDLRDCIDKNPSGGYYQTWTLSEHLAGRYLRNRGEIRIDKLPQGGYNVYPR